jgi:hypothetical protein
VKKVPLPQPLFWLHEDGEESSTEFANTEPILDGSAVFNRVRELD